ncbi:uncharacterized protein LOC122073040 [Macadamia integrifolia]|uniref:uncharacterized protein LOC122073040 n=1 Tax=Macadamia integrifolia TaxID=60698 RepID=UPI001C4F6434|nr:uncharacterized protein LOC122073040 [Macadamia integrifolia]
MGASSSTQQNLISPEQRELESEAASTGALPILHKAFSKLTNPQTNVIPLVSLQEIFSFTYNNPTQETTSTIPECFPRLLVHLGQAVVDLFFRADKGGVTWIEFLRGYISCCGRKTVSTSLNNLYRLYALASAKAGNPSTLEFESDDADSKINGFLMPSDAFVLLWLCWVMSQSSSILGVSEGKTNLDIPDIKHLVLSAVVYCAEVGNDLNISDCSISSLEYRLPVGKFHMWALTTVPGLVQCLTQYLHDRLQKCAAVEDELGPSNLSIGEISLTEANDTYLLTCGRAWAISLTQRGKLSEEILKASFLRDGKGVLENLLYRSAIHGKGLSRFWSNIEGYHGPLLILISANSEDAHGCDGNVRRWVIGILTEQGFENRDVFYGNSGCLYSISPVFHVFSSSGKEKNFIYSHLHPAGRVYEPHPKPVGIAFGGTIGNERIFVDEDFARLTIRHHAVDKSYQPGPLVPNQGFLPLEALIAEVEVWGLAGGKAKEEQSAYKNREQLFTEQRRKVDLKTFGSWEDSPEKMMMDMVTDPNQVKRENR